MTHFSHCGDEISCDMSEDEGTILINLAEQLLELLGEGDFYHHFSSEDPLAQLFALPEFIQAPEDPVLLRLLPNAYDDEEEASEFRRFTEGSLRARKQNNLKIFREELLIVVDEHRSNIAHIDPSAWLGALNDIRIALSIRLEIDEHSFDKFEKLPDEDPQKSLFAVYYWLGSVQESLINLIE